MMLPWGVTSPCKGEVGRAAAGRGSRQRFSRRVDSCGAFERFARAPTPSPTLPLAGGGSTRGKRHA
jgi:hypothetical protein